MLTLGSEAATIMADNKATGLAVNEVSNVSRWYDNRSVFITGATGFIGKVLVEKLLNSCPGINKIYLLLRMKKDVSPEKRLDQLKQAPIFDYLKKYYPQRLEKLVVITGDISEPELGISKEEQKILCQNVSVVFHSAATVKFDEALGLSVAMNMLGPRWIIKLCQNMPKLEAIVHVSTAYCNCNLSFVEEKIYPPPKEISKILKYVECLEPEILNEMTPRIIEERPNTYTFTKAMAENILLRESGDLPVVIIRPSIVTAALKSPLPGWIDSLNGLTGFIAGAGKGILRTILCDSKLKSDIIPVDIVINAMIVAAWSTAKKKNERMTVFNVVSGEENPVLWGLIEKIMLDSLRSDPFNDVFWYPGGSFKSNKTLNTVCHVLYHLFPAYLVDYCNLIIGKKSGGSMVKIQNKVQMAVATTEYFRLNEWHFSSRNFVKMQTFLSESDKKLFDINVRNIQWKPYMETYCRGVRRYVLKEDDKDFPKARQHLKKMRLIHYATKTVAIFLFLNFLLGNIFSVRKFNFSLLSYLFQLLKNYITLPLK